MDVRLGTATDRGGAVPAAADGEGRRYFDGQGHAAGGAQFTLDLTATDQAGATPTKVRTVSLDISDDDGKTWQPVTCVDHRGAVWRASLTNPTAAHGTGYVSTRVRATDAAGNTVEQTVIRAYGLS